MNTFLTFSIFVYGFVILMTLLIIWCSKYPRVRHVHIGQDLLGLVLNVPVFIWCLSLKGWL